MLSVVVAIVTFMVLFLSEGFNNLMLAVFISAVFFIHKYFEIYCAFFQLRKPLFTLKFQWKQITISNQLI